MAKATAKRKLKAASRATARKSSARRPVKAAAKTRAKAKRPRKHAFVASHLADARFEPGLRAYAHYRDLGVAQATGGLARAHVIRMMPPFDAKEVSKRHFHDVDFQMIYVLKGWMKSEFEGVGTITMREGSCWLQPPKIKHTVLGYSDDCEVLEIILPADFDTVEV
jgi:quercetin dioxygenase-like cupin family protein